LTVADFHRSIESPYDDPSLSAERRISQGKTRDFRSIYPPHIRSSGPDDIGLSVCWPLRPRTFASYGSCASDQSFAYGFLPTPHCCDAVATSAKGSCHQGPQRTFTSKSIPASLSLRGYQRQSWRFAPCLAHQ